MKFEKAREFLEKNKRCFGTMNLKLYDVAAYSGSEQMGKDFPLVGKKDDIYFYNFCEDAYNGFIDSLDFLGIDFCKMRNYIGRSSTFYLHDRNLFIIDEKGLNIDDTIYEFKHEKAVDGYHWTDEEMLEDVMEEAKHIITVYKEIEQYKKHQVEYYKEYLSYYEEELQQEQEQEHTNLLERQSLFKELNNETLQKICEKYYVEADDIRNIIEVIR